MAFGKYDPCENFFKATKDVSVKRDRNRTKQKAIPRVSKKRRTENKIYTKLREEFLTENPECQIKWGDKCSKIATQVHHVKFRGRYYLDTKYWKSGCGYCHRMVTGNGKEAERRGHVIREYKTPS